MAYSDVQTTPMLPSLGLSIIGDNFLVSEDFESLRDEIRSKGFDWLSMKPHCRIRYCEESFVLDKTIYMRNYSKKGLTLQELGEVEMGSKWLRGWLSETQLITILQLGTEDLLRGQRITKKEFQEDPKLILEMVRKAIHNLVALKSEYIEKIRPERLEFWKRNHHFGIYTLPNLKNYPFDGTEWTFDEYKEVSREQNTRLKEAKDNKHLKYTLLRPNIDNPSFTNRKSKDTGFPGFSFMKLEKKFMKPFVDPILRLVAQKFCSRCQEPLLQENLWKKATVSPANGQYSSVHCLPDELWREIFRKLTPFEVWDMKQTCKGFYRIHHQSRKCGVNIVLTREQNRNNNGVMLEGSFNR